MKLENVKGEPVPCVSTDHHHFRDEDRWVKEGLVAPQHFGGKSDQVDELQGVRTYDYCSCFTPATQRR